MDTRDKRVERAQTRVIFTVPFFAPGVAKLPVVWDSAVDTACTAGHCIRWNPEWFDSLKDSQVVTVLCHETVHCLLGHIWRAPDGADWDVWNQACDHAVNLMLKDFSATVTSKGLADPFPFPDPAEAFCANPAFKDMAEEVIYGRLASGKPPGGGGGGKPGSSGQSPQAGNSGKSRASKGKPEPGSMPSFGQIAKPQAGNGNAASQKKLGNDWQNTLIQSAKLASGQGTLPAGLERLVENTVNPQVPWWELLRSWLREQCADDWNWLQPAMEYEGSGFILPSLASERVGSIVFATDTSGSINAEMLAQFQTEKQVCLDEMRPKRLVDIYCDSRISKIEEYGVGDTITKQCPGGGGTDFRPVFAHIEKMDKPPKALVYLTDLYGSFPAEAPDYPVIWVVWSKGTTAPFGHVVYAPES